MSVLDQLPHVAEEEGEEKYPDVRAVDVGIGHDDDLAVSQLGDVEILSYAAAERLDDRYDRDVRIYLVKPALLDVEHLSAERKDGLKFRVAAGFGRTSRRISLDEIDLGERGVPLLAV